MKRKITLPWLAGFAATLSLLGAFLAQPNDPRVLQFKELTNDGLPKYGLILTDGKRLFFSEGWQGLTRIVSVPITGGKPTPVPIPPHATLQDISPDKRKLLFLLTDRSGIECLWQFSLNDNSVQRLFCPAEAAAWRGNDAISFVSHNSLFLRVLRPPRNTKQLAVIDNASALSWSPNEKILRFTVNNSGKERTNLMELAGHPRRLDYLEHKQRSAAGSSWSPMAATFSMMPAMDLARTYGSKKSLDPIPFRPDLFN